MFIRKILMILACCVYSHANAQKDDAKKDDAKKDSLYIHEVEDFPGRDKVLHAEPLYIDLIRDLGARKGEREWNLGMGISNNGKFDSYETLLEYEWAPVDRLGLEVELPFTFYSPVARSKQDTVPANKLNSLKMACQWSFFVSEKIATSMALGYIHEFEMPDFNNFGNPLVQGFVYNPFLIVAKRWGNNFHTLVYTGPRIEQGIGGGNAHTVFQINSNFHYMIPGTRNFIGIEFNKNIDQHGTDIVMRPQMRVDLAEGILVGIVAGIPVNRENQGLSSFIRLIWEPRHK